MQPCILYLVRHGQSVANRDGLVTGHLDAPLTELGEQQAYQTKKLLQKVKFTAAYSSNLQRAVDTGAIVYGAPIPIKHQLFDLREANRGKLQGQSKDKLTELIAVHTKRYGSLPLTERWGYSYADDIESNNVVWERFTKVLQQIARQHRGETVLVATHGGTLRILLTKLGYATEQELPFDSFQNAGYVEVTCNGTDFKLLKVVGVDKRHI